MIKEIDICMFKGEEIEKEFHSISPQIVQTSNFSFKTYDDFLKICVDEKNNYMYTRGSNPTTKILENKLAKLENGESCKVFSSGMGAITATLFTLLKSGDHILTLNTIYGQATTFMKYLDKYGVEYSNVRVDENTNIEREIKENTKIIYMESPSSQHMELLDLKKVVKIAKARGILTVIDNTWATSLFQKPLDYGVDLVIHSCSKYIGGSSDVVAGAVIGNRELVDEIFEHGHQNLGATNSPLNSWLLIRSLRTLPVRLNYLSESVKKVIDFLEKDERIKKVYHPYAAKGYQKELTEKYLKGYGSLLSFEILDEDFDKLKKFVDSLKVFKIGVSWGGYESLILPAFKGNNEENLKQRGMSKTHIRLYVGLEATETLIKDLKDSLDLVYGK